jgi:hypothetical protein
MAAYANSMAMCDSLRGQLLVGITTFKVATGESLNFAIAIDEFCR